MKHFYFLFVLLFSFNLINAQFCAPNGFSTGSKVYFVYDSGTSLCGERPSVITIEGSTYTNLSCADELSIYELDNGGTPVADINMFTADFGGSVGNCIYGDGTLPIDKVDIINRATLNVYPNPLSNSLNIELLINTSAKINIFDITGKLVMNDVLNNSSTKKINVSRLKNGIYLLMLQTDFSFITRKIVINN